MTVPPGTPHRQIAVGDGRVRVQLRPAGARPSLRALTPILHPALRWNHARAIARASEGLEPYARARVAV